MSRHGTVVLVALVLGIGLRAVWPLADLPGDLSWSGGELTDPPSNTLPARYAVEHGDWTRVRVAERLIYPLLNGLAWCAYSAFGTSRLAIVSLAAALGVAAVLLLGAGLRRGPGTTTAAIAVVLTSLGYWTAMYSRVLMSESVVAVLCVLSAYLALRSGRASLVAAGAALGVAALFGKPLALAFLPGLAVFLVLRSGPRSLFPMAAGLALAGGAWLVGIFLPHRTELLHWVGRSSLALGATSEALERLPLAPFATLRDSWMLPQMPVLACVAAWFAITTVSRRETLRERIDDGSALFALWLLGAFAAYSLLPYHPPRYFVPLAFPIAACAAAQLADLLSRLEARPLAVLPRFLFLVFLSFVALDVERHLELRLGVNPGGLEPSMVFSDVLEPLPTHVAWSIGLAALLFVADVARRRMSAAIPPRRRIAGALVAVILAVDLAQWARWWSHRTYAVEQATEAVAAFVGPDAVLAGGYAPLLTLGSGRLAVPRFGWTEAPELSEDGITHVLLVGDSERADFEKRFPAAAGRLARVQRWPMPGFSVRGVELYRLPPDVGDPAYQPTDLERASDAVEAKEWDAALDLLQRVRGASVGEPLPDVLALEADCFWGLGNPDKARERLVEAIGRRPFDPLLHLNLGVLAWNQGDKESARQHWTQALLLDPRATEVRMLLHQVPS